MVCCLAELAHGQELPSLGTFIEAARNLAIENREAQATSAMRLAESREAASALKPSATVTGLYTRNQYAAVARVPDSAAGALIEGVFVARNQRDTSLSIDLPLLNLTAYHAASAADVRAQASVFDIKTVRDELDISVTRAYFTVLSAEAVVSSAHRARQVAERELPTASARLQAGLASDLDVARAQSRLERLRQTVADAELARARSIRDLRTFTGIDARVARMSATVIPGPTMDAEGPLTDWLQRVDQLPAVRAAEARATADQLDIKAARSEFLPSLRVTASERFTNAFGFGTSPSWAVGLQGTLRLDFGSAAQAQIRTASLSVTRLVAERARRDARDAIEDAWLVVQATRARLAAAQAEVIATRRAAEVARARLEAGTAIQLDALTAESDVLAAEVAHIQAEADLAFARVQLRILAGRGDEALR